LSRVEITQELGVALKSFAARIARTLRTLHSTATAAYQHHRKPT